MNQYDTRERLCVKAVAVLTVLLGSSGVGHHAARPVCYAVDVEPTEEQKSHLRLSDLQWTLAVSARDDHHDPIRAAHHFLRAAQAARLAGQESRVTSYLIAASFPARARDRYLIHPVRGGVFSPDSNRLLTYNESPSAWLWDVGQTEPLRSLRHGREILAAMFNRDATRVLSYSRDGTVRLWEIERADPLAIFRHDHEVTGATFTSDETKVLSWSKDKTARLWDVKRPGQPLFTFRHDGPVIGAVFNADETQLLTSGDDNTARLWNVKTGKLIHKLVYEPRDHLDAWMKTTVYDAAFCDDESRIFFRCYDGVWLWDAASGTLVSKFIDSRRFTGDKPRFITQREGVVTFYNDSKGPLVRTFNHGLDVRHKLDVQIAAFNDNRTRFLTRLDWRYYYSTELGWVQLWDTDGEKPLRSFRHDGHINGAGFAKLTDHILTYSQDGTARLWDVSQGNAPRTIRHRRSVTGALLSPNEKLLLTWTDRGTARLTELHREDRGELLGRFKPDYPGYFAWTRLPPDGLRAVTWDPYERTLRHVDIAKNEPLRSFTIDSDVDNVIVSPDGSHMFARGDGPGWLWNLNEAPALATIDGAETPVFFSNDASRMFFCTKEGGVLFDVKRRKAVRTFVHVADGEYIAQVIFTADSIRIFTRGLRHLRLWDIDGDAPLRSFRRNQRIIRVVFSADGKRLITWDESQNADPNVHLWDIDHNQPRHTFRRKDDFDRAVFSPDGQRILSWHKRARLWDVGTGRLLTTFRRRTLIASARFTPDGHRVLTVGWDGKAYLWDSHQEEPLRTFQHTAMIRRPAFADIGSSLIGQGDNSVMHWSFAVDRQRTIEQHQRDYELKTATRLDQSGRLHPLSLEEWQQIRAAKVNPDDRARRK